MKRKLAKARKGDLKKKIKLDNVQIPKKTFNDFYGYSDIIKELSELLFLYKRRDLLKKLATPNFLFYGPECCGKSLLAEAIAGELGWNLIRGFGLSDLQKASSIKDLFESAIREAPCVLVLEDLQELCDFRNGSYEMDRDLRIQLDASFEAIEPEDRNKVVIIGTTTCVESVHQDFRCARRFDREFFIELPNRNSRYEILKHLAEDTELCHDLDIMELATATPGFCAPELLRTLPNEASRVHLRRREKDYYKDMTEDEVLKLKLQSWPHTKQEIQPLGMDEFNEALKLIKPYSKRTGFPEVPKVKWDQVGGSVQEARRAIEDCFIAPVKYPEVYSVLTDKEPSGGILLYGPPGCGKTLIAKAVANETNFNFLSVRGPELLSMHVGESERAVRECFDRARSNQPCIIFFDEIDSICQKRLSSTEGHNDSSEKIVSQMLTEMDGMRDRKGVYIFAATNRPQAIDKALLRPGRLGKKIYIGIPSAEDRVDILKALTKVKPPIKDVDLDILGKDSSLDGFTGADLGGLVYRASLSAIDKKMKYVTMDLFYEAAQHMVPSVSPATREKFEAMRGKI